MMSFRTVAATLLLLAVATAFVPAQKPAFGVKQTSLNFGFLKELGLEKPSWLPDFGGEKTEEPAATAEEGEDDAEATEEAEE